MERSVESSVGTTLEGEGGVMLRTHSKQAYWTYTFLSFLRHPRIHQMGTMTTEHSPQPVTCNTARSPQYTARSP